VGGDCVIKAGGEVKILQFVDGQSTTAMINKARQTE
jgi:D-beta-D-heptose 7-phosphate kinase/D-beta-D-heptose 1-phosphate adenosyltransferase